MTNEASVKKIKTMCNVCQAGCSGVMVHVKDNAILKVEGAVRAVSCTLAVYDGIGDLVLVNTGYCYGLAFKVDIAVAIAGIGSGSYEDGITIHTCINSRLNSQVVRGNFIDTSQAAS